MNNRPLKITLQTLQQVRDSVDCFLYPEEYTQEIEVENIGDDDDLESVDRQENDNDKVAYGWYRRRHMGLRIKRRYGRTDE